MLHHHFCWLESIKQSGYWKARIQSLCYSLWLKMLLMKAKQFDASVQQLNITGLQAMINVSHMYLWSSEAGGGEMAECRKIKLLVVKFMVACQNSRHNAAEKIFFGHRVDHRHAWHIMFFSEKFSCLASTVVWQYVGSCTYCCMAEKYFCKYLDLLLTLNPFFFFSSWIWKKLKP